MTDGCTVVVDVGKTNTKVSLWSATGELLSRLTRTNQPQLGPCRGLDVSGIDAWLVQSLRQLAKQAHVSRIVPVAHGAAAALLRGNKLSIAPMDYEDEVPASERAEYELQRDPFALTGSPALPRGLNLGIQLHRFEQQHGSLPADVVIVPWAQYWAWRLCGVAASEVTSLGCHTDLWRPERNEFSPLAIKRGWAERFAPLRRADDVLGVITPQVARDTQLPSDCTVLCGLHDSNAALLAARGHAAIGSADTTVLSTGTWFVAMRSLASGDVVAQPALDPTRDCLINVDVFGRPVPSARFMGGREAEIVAGVDCFAPAVNYDPEDLLSRLPDLIKSNAAVMPSFLSGVGPFPTARGTWRNKPADAVGQRALTDLYLALLADTALELIGSRDAVLIEGRFADAVVFTRALASLRPTQRVYVSHAQQDVACGALRLVDPQLQLQSDLAHVEPLAFDIGSYASTWRARVGTEQRSL